ncbi:hypothetical protein [Streptomyces griseorubiginosus]|uniref:hypothetical protein n=1 Tax=Streptomyces griseorubiginosus TaxID=67304 RepID=UPI001AD6AD6F|nr:hypothetical protein [Streptomyces griseorubiginosus]MBO4257476.1 hypothetical protein [Streptomyces griseorubiginosus]
MSNARGEQEPRPPSWRALITGLLIALAMTTIMVTTYVSAQHAVVARDLPWGVTGSSPLTTAVQKHVSLSIHHYKDQAALEDAAGRTEIYGGFVPQSNTVVIAEAASLVAPGQMPAFYEQAAKAAGVHLAFKVTNKLPKEDPLGVVPGIAVFVLLVAGYLGSTLAMQRTGAAAARRRVLSLICYAIIASLVFDVIIGPILGAYPDIGSNFWPLWGEFALMCLAVALLAATLQSLIGPLGTLLTVVIVVFFGNPSTGGVNGTAYLPAFWQYLGPVLPPWNGTTLVRNTLYFDGNAITLPLVVLSVYVVVGAALVIIATYGRLMWWRGGKRRRPISPEEEGGIAAIPPA